MGRATDTAIAVSVFTVVLLAPGLTQAGTRKSRKLLAVDSAAS
jgi:hypothetical protein